METNTGQAIKNARMQKKMTQADLAKSVGLATVTIRQYENGSREPKVEILRKIAIALGVSVASLVDISDLPQVMVESLNEESAAYGEEWSAFNRMRTAFSNLNHKGAERAAQAVEDLAKIPEYQNKDKILARKKEDERVAQFWKENVDSSYDPSNSDG